MKTFLLLAVSFSMALVQAVKAEDQDQVKAQKNRPKAAQSSQPAPPRVTPRIQRNAPPTYVGPKASHWQPPINQPRGQTGTRVRANPDMPRTFNRVPQTTATVQPDLNVRNRNWDRTRNWNNSNWRNRVAYNNSWEEARRRHYRQHHPRDWWRSHFTRFALFGTGYYFWDSGYWYPAYGYDPSYNTYEYEEPIYGYGDLEPAQVIANVQTELQRLGYYPYAVDGQMGPMTRAAIANYQRDTGLAITSAIDEPTLDSLGLE